MRAPWLLVPILALVVTFAHAQDPEERGHLIARSGVWQPTDVASMDVLRGPGGPGAFAPGETITCQYTDKEFDGRSQKFACRTSAGDELKVKFGEDNGEVVGEVAASRLLWALGFVADRMYPVRVICRGCPASFGPDAGHGARLVEPAAVERKTGREYEPAGATDWSWAELDSTDERVGGATRAQRDALKLLAVFLQHTDSKPEQQRIVCLDDGHGDASRCDRPMLMLDDVGLTFGRANLINDQATASANLDAWVSTPVWRGELGCLGNLPRSLSGTLKDPVVGDEGRRFLASLLGQLSDAQIRNLFEAAGAARRSGTDVDAWVRAFKEKRESIASRRCLDTWAQVAPPTFGTGPNRWLQSHATPALTRVMNAISLLGYTGVYMGAAVLLAFAYRLRAGAALLLLIVLNALVFNAVKTVVAFPRPDAVDSRVEALGLLAPANLAADASSRDGYVARLVSAAEKAMPRAARPSELRDSDFGFPSGHVASAAVFCFGLVFLFGWRWAWWLMAVWVPVMALSRMYLGRHFLGDVLGGFGVAVVVTAIGVLGLRLARYANPARDRDRVRRIARRAIVTAALLVLMALILDVPRLPDAARLLGVALGMLLVAIDRRADDNVPVRVRAARLAAAVVIFPVAWWTIAHAVAGADPAVHAIGATAVPAALLVPGALYLGHGIRRLESRVRNDRHR